MNWNYSCPATWICCCIIPTDMWALMTSIAWRDNLLHSTINLSVMGAKSPVRYMLLVCSRGVLLTPYKMFSFSPCPYQLTLPILRLEGTLQQILPRLAPSLSSTKILCPINPSRFAPYATRAWTPVVFQSCVLARSEKSRVWFRHGPLWNFIIIKLAQI